MKAAAFAYHAPRSKSEAVALLAEHGLDGKILAGGQSLVPTMAFRLAKPAVLIDINGIAELDFCRVADATLQIGCLTRHARFASAVETGPVGRLLAAIAGAIAHTPIRTRGTFCGSLAHADPASEWCCAALVLQATMVIAGPAGDREVAAADWFQSIFTTALQHDELLVEARIPLLAPAWRCGFNEFSRRDGDFALAMSIVALRLENGVIAEARIGLGGVGSTPILAQDAAASLLGHAPGEAAFATAAEHAAICFEPTVDINATPEYRQDLVRAVVKRAPPERLPMTAPVLTTDWSATSWTGQRLPRLEDPALLRGEGRYTADIAGTARAVRFLRSPVAAGRILGIAPTEPLPPGVLLITGKDLAGLGDIRPSLSRFDYITVGQPVLPAERVHFVGQPVAALVADTEALAEDAADLIWLDIEAETPVVDPQAAMRPGAPSLHREAPGNVLVEGNLRQHGIDEAFGQAAHIVTLDIVSRRQNATPMEARGGVASFERATGRIRLTASCQMPHMLRTGIAQVLGMPEADLAVIAPDVGGAFGQKMSLFPEYPLLVWLARKYRRDFAWIEDRNENLVASAHSRDQRHALRAAFDADGTLRGLDVDIVANVGAFSCYPTTCGVEPLMAFAEYPGPYKVPAYAARSRGVVTNTCPIAPYRGVSRPAITFGIERLMDRAAAQLGLDRVAIRRRNLVDQFPHTTATGLVLDAATYIEAMDVAIAQADLPGFRARQAAARAQGRYLGLGFSVFNERTGYGTPAFAARGMAVVPGYEVVDIAMTPGGEVELRIGASPHGQGLRTTLAQLVADQLGITPAAVRVVSGDTDRTPYGWGSFASRGAVIAGGAAQKAAAQLAIRLRAAAATMLQCTPDQVVLREGQAFAGEASIPIPELARLSHHRSDLFASASPNLAETASYDPGGTFSNACHVAEVEVDIETGHVRITRYLVVEDAGLLLNPMIADGQVRGGVVQGIANALFEEVIYDDDGNNLTGSLADYLLPTAAEVPDIEIIHLVTISPETATGAKGLGEGGAIGAPAAIANAVTDALTPFGVEINELPATPARVRALLRGKAATP